MHWASRVGLAGALAGNLACGGSGPAEPSMAQVTGVSVTGAAPVVGGTSQFSATAAFSNGQSRNVTAEATWISSAPSIATVTGSGLVTATSTGGATISATFQ